SRVIRISLFYQNSTCFVSAYFLKHHLKSYIDLLKDRTFYLPMSIGGLCGGVMFTFLNSASALMIGEFNLSEKVFSLIFGLNGIGIILFSLLSKFLIKTRSIKFILFWGLLIQLFGILLLGIGYFFISKNLIDLLRKSLLQVHPIYQCSD
ncbi:hypothetical protein ABTJ36_17695, partial [Acinetobacter baumannii]